MSVRLLCSVLLSLVLSHAQGQSNGVCYKAVVETSTISVSVVVSYIQYYSCGWWSTCSSIEYSTQQVYTTISQHIYQFACCHGYMQIGTSQACRANITSGPAIPQLNTVAVNATDNPNFLHAIWSLSNNTNVSSLSFNASCTAQDGSHHVDYSVGQSLNATFGGLRPSTFYSCCVHAVVAGNAGYAMCGMPTQTKGNINYKTVLWVCMCLCVWVCMCLCVYVGIHVCVYMWVCMCLCVYMWVCMCLCVYVGMHIFVCICGYACVCVYMWVCMCLCVYVGCA